MYVCVQIILLFPRVLAQRVAQRTEELKVGSGLWVRTVYCGAISPR